MKPRRGPCDQCGRYRWLHPIDVGYRYRSIFWLCHRCEDELQRNTLRFARMVDRSIRARNAA